MQRTRTSKLKPVLIARLSTDLRTNVREKRAIMGNKRSLGARSACKSDKILGKQAEANFLGGVRQQDSVDKPVPQLSMMEADVVVRGCRGSRMRFVDELAPVKQENPPESHSTAVAALRLIQKANLVLGSKNHFYCHQDQNGRQKNVYHANRCPIPCPRAAKSPVDCTSCSMPLLLF